MMMKKLMMTSLFLASAVGWAAPVLAQQEARMVSSQLAGWDLVHFTQLGPTPTWEYVPRGETKQEWSKKINMTIFRTEGRLMPRTHMESTIRLASLGCEGYGAAGYREFMENGFPAATWTVVCGKNKTSGKGEIMWFKAIRGPVDFNVARMAWRVEPYDVNSPPWNEPMLGESMGFMHSFSLCLVNEAGDNCGKTFSRKMPMKAVKEKLDSGKLQ